MRALLAAALLAFAVAAFAAAASRATGGGATTPRLAIEVERGNADAELETRLLESILEGGRAAKVRLVLGSNSMTPGASCDDALACRLSQLGAEAELRVRLEPGPLPGVWVLNTSLQRPGEPLRWLRTAPFSPHANEHLDAAVARVGRTLGAALQPAGHSLRVPVVAAAERPIDCAHLGARAALPVWETANLLRAHLYRSGRADLGPEAVRALKAAVPLELPLCEQLTRLTEFQHQAINRNWLPRQLAPERWVSNVDVRLAGEEASRREAELVSHVIAGAFAAQGVTPRNIGDITHRCPEGIAECPSGYDFSLDNPNVWVLLLDAERWEGGQLQLRATLWSGSKRAAPRRVDLGQHRLSPWPSGPHAPLDAAIAGAISTLAPE
jgi:hypothetical protein